MAGKQPRTWTKERIKAELRMKHGSLEALAKSWGFHPSAISVALKPASPWPALELRIAAELEQPPHALWPYRWHPDGTRRLSSIGADDTENHAAPHRPKSQAA